MRAHLIVLALLAPVLCTFAACSSESSNVDVADGGGITAEASATDAPSYGPLLPLTIAADATVTVTRRRRGLAASCDPIANSYRFERPTKSLTVSRCVSTVTDAGSDGDASDASPSSDPRDLAYVEAAKKVLGDADSEAVETLLRGLQYRVSECTGFDGTATELSIVDAQGAPAGRYSDNPTCVSGAVSHAVGLSALFDKLESLDPTR